jgi:hypothetical protein
VENVIKGSAYQQEDFPEEDTDTSIRELIPSGDVLSGL